MKKPFFRLLFVFSLLILCIFSVSFTVSAASGTCGENLTWSLDDSGTLTISGTGDMYDYSSSSKAPWYTNYVYLPQVHQIVIGKDVTSIGDYAFYEYSYLTKAYINATNIEIGEKAFYMCYNLATVSMTGDTAKIGKSSFAYCSELEYLKFPTYVNEIGDNAFSSCIAIEGSLSIAGVDSANIGKSAFSDCRSITNIYLNGDFGNICENAFVNCSSLVSAKIEAHQIGTSAFSGCSKLSTVTIGEKTSKIDNNAFKGCGIKNVNISNIASWCNINFANQYANPLAGSQRNLYLNTVLVEDLVIPNSVEKIGPYAFMNYSELKTISLPEGLNEISKYAFYGCSSLTNTILPKNLTSIGEYAFYNCIGIEEISIPNGVTAIEDYTFFGCGIKSIYIPDTVTTIGVYALSGCTFSSIDLPDNLVVLSDGIFKNCINLRNVFIPNSVSSIGNEAFYKCNAMSNLVIPKSVTTIGYSAFSSTDSIFTLYCHEESYAEEYLKSKGFNYIVISDVMANGNLSGTIDWCLYNNGVLRITGDGKIPENAENVWLSHTETIKLISVEDGIENVPDGLVNHCTNLERIRIASSIDYIDVGSFSNLLNLKKIEVSSNNIAYSSTNEGLFNKDQTVLMLVLPKGISYYIPDSVNTIEENSFLLNNSIEIVIIPVSVTNIIEGSFTKCKNIRLYGQVDSVAEAYATEHNIPFQLLLDTGSFGTNAKYYIFDDGLMLVSGTGTTINSPVWKTEYNKNVTSVIVEEGITGLGTSAFASCNNIESVFLPESLINFGTSAFNGCTKLKSICIPKGVTTLSNSVFYNCDGLTEIIIPNSVTTIGDYAFYSCSGLTEIRIPDSVTTIGNYAFKYSAIKDIDIGNGVTNIGEQAFYDSDLESITLGKSIKSIGKNAFTYCYITKVNLTSIEAWLNISFGNASSNPLGDTMYSSADLYVNNELAIHITIPDGVTKIGEDAFYYCDKIRSITIPSSVTHIGESAFYDCEKLLDVYFEGTREQWNSIEKTNSYIEVACIHCADEAELPYSPESDFVFSNGVISGYTGSDKIINVPATIGGIPVKMIADEAFHGASATQVYLPEGIVQIGKCAFQTSSVRRVNIPSTVKSIGSYAFYITDIVEIEIPAGIKTVPTYTFAYCSNLEKITIPSSIETMESDAFCSTHVEELHISDLGAWCNISFADSDSTPMYSNTLLYVNDEVAIDVTIPDNATQISKYAFYKYDELKSVVVPSSVKSIGDYAFYECSALENIVIPDGITKIGYQSFYECSSLERVSIPDSVTNIGYQSFYNCSTLDYVKIGSGVKSIDNSAFAGCSKLTEVDMGDNVTYMGSGVFKDCVSLQSIIIPQVTTIPSNSFYNCYALKQIEIPKTVTSIGSAAFYACYGLTDVYYKGNKDVWATISISTDNEALSTATIHFAELPEISLSTTYAMDVDSKVFLTQTKNIPLGSSVLLACYDEFGIFTHMQRKQYDVESDHISFYVPLNVTTDNAKIMVWEDIYDMQPLCASENVITSSKSYLVKYDANGGIDAPSPQIKEHDINIWLTANTPTREGYDFAGWATNPNGPLTYSSDVLYTKNEPVTLYALWEVAKYDVVYNVNGGYGYFENAIKTHNEDLTLTSQEPTKSGYTFVGWSTTPTGEVEYISNGIYSKNEDAILYAVWELEYYSYTINNGEVTITDCDTSLSGDIVIPSYKQGYPVTTIGSYAFDDCDSITSIVVPETVTTLEDYAFSGCLYVKKITLPNSIESIGNSAFEWNYYMEEVNIPDGITSIGNNTFYSCGYLKSINIPDGVTSIGISAFEGCSSLEEIDIPASVETLGAKAFSRCAIKNIKLPDNLTTIESGLFYSTGLTSITIPSNVSEIKSEAFRQCYKLTSVTIPKSVTYIGMYAFYTGDGDVYYEGTQEEWEKIDIDYNNEFLSNATIHYNQTIN